MSGTLLYTIYLRPSDLPGTTFVTRPWLLTPEGEAKPTDAVTLSDTLEEARSKLPPDCIPLGREAFDDPVIVETWIMSGPVFPNTTNTRTWEYGTTKQVIVDEVIRKAQSSVGVCIICYESNSVDLHREGFILLLDNGHLDAQNVKAGDEGTITFKQGGPTLGYWDYSSVAQSGGNDVDN